MKRKFGLIVLLALTLLTSCGGKKKSSGGAGCDGNVCRIGTVAWVLR